MCSLKVTLAIVVLSSGILAAPGGDFGRDEGSQGGYAAYGQRGGNQGGQGGFGGQQGGQGGFGGNQGGQGQPGGQFMPPPPPFLQNVTEEARRAFMAIATNSSLTLAEIETQTEAWATTYGVTDQYNNFIANVTSKIEELKQNVTSVLTNMSSVMNSLETILENTDQTVAQQQEAIESLREESPAEVGALFFIAQEVAKPARQGPRGGVSGRPSGFSTTTVSA